MTEDLANRDCRPCLGGVAPLSPEAVETSLAAVPDWALAEGGTRLLRRFTLRTYAQAFDLVARVSALAEAQRHHPDVLCGWLPHCKRNR